jgi:hypothetical protein
MDMFEQVIIFQRPSCSWSYGSWIYNYLRNQIVIRFDRETTGMYDKYTCISYSYCKYLNVLIFYNLLKHIHNN